MHGSFLFLDAPGQTMRSYGFAEDNCPILSPAEDRTDYWESPDETGLQRPPEVWAVKAAFAISVDDFASSPPSYDSVLVWAERTIGGDGVSFITEALAGAVDVCGLIATRHSSREHILLLRREDDKGSGGLCLCQASGGRWVIGDFPTGLTGDGVTALSAILSPILDPGSWFVHV